MDMDQKPEIPEHWEEFPNLVRGVVISTVNVSATRKKSGIVRTLLRVLQHGSTMRSACADTHMPMSKMSSYYTLVCKSLKQVLGDSREKLSPEALQKLHEEENEQLQNPTAMPSSSKVALQPPTTGDKSVEKPGRGRPPRITNNSLQNYVDITPQVTEWLAKQDKNGKDVAVPAAKRARRDHSLSSGGSVGSSDGSSSSSYNYNPQVDRPKCKTLKYLEDRGVPNAERLAPAINYLFVPMLQASIRHGVSTEDIAKHLHALECFQNSKQKKEGGCSSITDSGTQHGEVDGDGDHHGDRVKDKEDKENLSQVIKPDYCFKMKEPLEELIEEMHVGETDAIKMDALIDFIVRSRCLLTASQKSLSDALKMHLIEGVRITSILPHFPQLSVITVQDYAKLCNTAAKFIWNKFPVYLTRCKQVFENAKEKQVCEDDNFEMQLGQLVADELEGYYVHLTEVEFPLSATFTLTVSGLIEDIARHNRIRSPSAVPDVD